MFSATMTPEIWEVCKKFMHDPHEISVDKESKLTLHGLLQYFVKLTEKENNRKLNDLSDALEFNEVQAIRVQRHLCEFSAARCGLGQDFG